MGKIGSSKNLIKIRAHSRNKNHKNDPKLFIKFLYSINYFNILSFFLIIILNFLKIYLSIYLVWNKKW